MVNTHDDEYQTALCKRVWKSLIKDLYPLPVFNFFNIWFNNTDLYTLIGEAQSISDCIIFNTAPINSKFKLILDMCDRNDTAAVRKALTVLRFPKRFTPVKLSGDTAAFWETNDRLSQLPLNPNGLLLSELRATFEELLIDYYRDPEEWSLTSGATFDKDKTMEQKLLSVEKIYPDLLGYSLGTPVSNIMEGSHVPYHYNRIKVVPKAYNKTRNIAIEPEWIGVKSQSVARAIERCLPSFCQMHNQMHNFNLAKLGSIDNSLATIDLHAASDSVSTALLSFTLPQEVFNDIRRVTSWSEFPRRNKWGEVVRQRPYHMISTMGNRVTFPLECLVFSAVVITCARMSNIRLTSSNTGVYGDDIIVPNELAPSVISVLECLGFIVNEEKSFFQHEFFRESCGGEFFHGEPVTSLYWPRQALVGKGTEDFSVLIALQHKFARLPYTNDTLTKEIRKIFPKVTESMIGSEYDDIWSPYPDICQAHGSYDLSKGAGEEESSCELHTTICNVTKQYVFNANADRFFYYKFLKYGSVLNEDPVLAAIGYPADSSIESFCDAPSQKIRNAKYLI